MQATIHEQAAQAAWELEGVRRSVERYREAAKAADPLTLAPGKALVRGVVTPLIAAIRGLQDASAEALSTPGRQPEYAWPLQVIEPEKAAVIVLSVACRAGLRMVEKVAGNSLGGTLAAHAKEIAGALRDQLHYDRWVASERQLNKEAARSQVEGHKDRLYALQKRYPTLDRRVWRKWAAKLELAALAEWDEKQAIVLGSALLRLLCDVAPDKFVIEERKTAVGVQYVLGVTEQVREVMNDVTQRAEVARPLLMPMICPPNPWQYEGTQ